MSGFGLSAFFFSSLSHLLFPGNTSDFLLVLALGTALPMVLGFFFVRPIPLPPHELAHTLEHGPDQYERVPILERDESYARRNTSQTRLLDGEDEDEEEEEHNTGLSPFQRQHSQPTGPLSDSVELSPSATLEGFQNRSRSRSVAASRREAVVEKIVEGRGVDLSAWGLWTSADFYLVFGINMLRMFLFIFCRLYTDRRRQ